MAAGVEHIEVRRVLGDVAALAAAGRVVPTAARPPRLHVVPTLAGNADRGVVLLGSAYMVGKVVRDIHMVQLGSRIRLTGPGVAAVDGDIAAAVVRVAHAHRIVRVDPEVVLVAVRRTDDMVEGLTAVVRTVEAGIQRIHAFRIHRVGVHPRVVEGALAQLPLVVRETPGGAPVVGAEHAAFGGFHDGPYPIRIRRGNGHADLADRAGRHTRVLGEFGPGVPAVVGAVEPGIGAAAPHLPGLPVHLPQGGVEHLRIRPVDDEVRGAGFRAHEEDPLPGVPAVRRAEDAALFVVPVGMAQRGHIHDVRVHRMDADAGDRLGIREAHLAPGLPAVAASIDAVALGDAAAQLRFAAADEDDVRVGLRHRDRADRGTRDLAVGHRKPGSSRIEGLPQPAAGRAEVVLVAASGAAGTAEGPSAAQGADVPPLHRAEEGLVEREIGGGVLCGGARRREGQGEKHGQRSREGGRNAPEGPAGGMRPGFRGAKNEHGGISFHEAESPSSERESIRNAPPGAGGGPAKHRRERGDRATIRAAGPWGAPRRETQRGHRALPPGSGRRGALSAGC